MERRQRTARESLLPLVYGELRKLAQSMLRQERSDHTLQPTALVNELYLRLVDQRRVSVQDRRHFFGLAAYLMRRVLVDHARRKKAAKRGAEAISPLLEEPVSNSWTRDVDLEALNEALERLEEDRPQEVPGSGATLHRGFHNGGGGAHPRNVAGDGGTRLEIRPELAGPGDESQLRPNRRCSVSSQAAPQWLLHFEQRRDVYMLRHIRRIRAKRPI